MANSNPSLFRPYDPKRDRDSVLRIWRESHWLDWDSESDGRYLDIFLANTKARVADIEGTAECIVTSVPGNILHGDQDIPLDIVSSVTTSLVARKQGLASRLTAAIIAEGAEAGHTATALGMFEQGYYSRLGFGNGPYELKTSFNPSQIDIPSKARVPERLGIEHAADMHQALLQRWRSHGGVQISSIGHLEAELGWTDHGIGMGYRNKKGELTHFFWGEYKEEYGPLKINFLAYRNRQQLLELLALIRNFGDQLLSVQLVEPPHAQLQDFLTTPFREQNISQGGNYPSYSKAEAYWQIRINDVAGCLAKTRLRCSESVSFNAQLEDPITQYLDDRAGWNGVSGDYTIHLGQQCEASSGHTPNLPLMKASIGAFSRLWLGCANASTLSCSDTLDASQDLLDKLDRTLCLPLPKVGWEF